MYKICYLTPTSKKYYVFAKESDYNTLEESKKDDGAERVFVDEEIHLDDTIEEIKKKIIIAFKEQISFDEIYLFAIHEISLNPIKTYTSLTQNGKLELTEERLFQFLRNFEDSAELIDLLPKKEVYDFNDIVGLDLSKKRLIKFPIGQKFNINQDNYYYTVNPYDMIENDFDEFLKEHAENIISTQNGQLLLNYKTIQDNMIYLVLAEDVLTKRDEPLMSKIYYPFLFKKNIDSLVELKKNKEILLSENKKLITTEVLNKFENIDLFYDLYKNPYPEIKKGVSEISFNIHPEQSFILPLEHIFKLLHASSDIPLIKFNSGVRKEKLYRLYAPEQTQDGRRVPYLSKGTIFKLIKSIGTRKSVSLYIKVEGIEHIICTLLDNGIVEIEFQGNKVFQLQEITDLIVEKINPIIEIIKNFIEQSGLSINFFSSLYDANIEILDINYVTELEITKNINLSKILGCLNPIFNVIESDLKKGIVMRFKRVANYNTMNAQYSFIIELINKGVLKDEILERLSKNFNYKLDEAEKMFIKFLNEVNLEHGLFENKKLKIKDNPGFLSTIKLDKLTNKITIQVNKINSIEYLDTIPIYLSSMISITQNPTPLANKLCKKKGKVLKEEEKVEDIDAVDLSETSVEIEKGQELIFNEENDDDILDMLIGSDIDDDDDDDDDDEDEDLNFVGGDDSDDESPEIELGSDIEGIISDMSVSDDIDIKSDIDIESDTASPASASPASASPASASPASASPAPASPVPASPSNLKVEGIVSNKSLEMLKKQSPTFESDSESDSEEIIKDITGLQLSNPNYFFQRMEKRDPTLFLKKKEGKFNAYSRMCPSNARRQPIILNDKEKAKIDKDHPGSYSHAIHYGSDPDKKHWYICPRYWCLSENTSLTEEEVKAGKCGGVDAIIPFGARKVPPGKKIFEFNAKSEHIDSDGNYIEHHPGFIPKSKHPDNLCIPCCFKSWKAPEQIKRRKECSQEKDSSSSPPLLKRIESVEPENYIKGIEKFPLDQNRWGYLPIAVQLMLNVNNKKCQISETDTNIKLFTPCLLRHGVEVNAKQSFVACLSDLYVDYIKRTNIPTIKEMKQTIIDAINLDTFPLYQNGNLIELFYDESKSVNVDDYSATDLYKKLDTTSEKSMRLFEKIVSAYENFITYLKDDDVVIDYEYLWDIVTMPNSKLFPKGINLVILEIIDDDVTDNIEIICPTNHYSTMFYDTRKSTLLLVKKNEFYEPIYQYTDLETKITVTKTFNEYSKLSPQFKSALKMIKNNMNKYCGVLPSQPKVYEFKQAILYDKLLSELKTINAVINFLVINYNSKVIGINITVPQSKNNDNVLTGFVPCYPTGLNYGMELLTKFADDLSIWNNYEDTVAFLKKIHGLNKNIPTKVTFKVVEQKLVIGVLTETNQFITVTDPKPPIQDNIPEMSNKNYLIADSKTILNDNIDEERIKYIKHIQLEENFYMVFRNLVRIMLNKFENRLIKGKVLDILKDTEIDYYKKLDDIVALLHELVDNYVQFVEYDKKILYSINTVGSCYNLNSCNKPYCLKSEESGGPCQFLIPLKNLLSNKNNDEVYFGKIADELVRFNRIKLFILDPSNYLTFNEIPYEINDDEIILFQSLITQKYFEDLVSYTKNKYIKTNTFDGALPLKSEPYSEKITETAQTKKKKLKLKLVKEIECKKITTKIKGKWNKLFPETFNQIGFDNTVGCTFDLMMRIFKNKTISTLKKVLVKKYALLIKEFNEERITDILVQQGKQTMMKLIKSGNIKFDATILSEYYYLTNLDIWILCEHYKVNFIFLSSTKLKENDESMLLENFQENKSGVQNYVIIHSPGIKVNTIPGYSLLLNENNSASIALGESMDMKKFTDFIADQNKSKITMTLKEYISSFQVKAYPRKKKKRKLVIVK